MKRRLCLIGLHRWQIVMTLGHDWLPERMCKRCGRWEPVL